MGIGLGLIPTAARPGTTTAPANVVKPSFDGILTQGQSADVNPGSWTGLPSPNFTYAIKRGATTVSTDPAYVWTSADVAAGANAMTVEVTATNDVGPTTETSDPVTIAAPLAISGTPGAALVGTPYTFTPGRTGGHAPYAFALTGTLPSGLSFSTSTGAITGTPSTSGTASLSIKVTDGDGLQATLGPFDLVVSAEEPGGPVSAINSLAIMNATPLDATGDYGDATARTGIDGNGWVGVITVPYLVGQTFDPSKIVLTVSDPGSDGSGATTPARTIRGAEVLRRQYNAASSKQQSNNGVTLTVYFALSGLIYEGSTLTAASAEAGYYGSSAAGSVSSLANNSTRPYYKPHGAVLNMQHDRATGDYVIEVAADSRYGRNGRMLARVEVIASDASGHTTATQIATTPVLSSIQTQGDIAEVYRVTVPLSALNQGELCQANIRLVPWIGDSTAILDFAADGYAWPTANPQTPLRFLNDKAGTYGGAIAFVRAGAGGTGVVSRDPAVARASPFATLALAFAALAAFNNTNSTPAHNDHSGSTIYLMDNGAGGAVAHTIAASITTAAGLCWTDIRKDPSATGAVSLTMDAIRAIPDKTRWFVDINHTAGNGFDGGSGGGAKMLAFGGGTITSTSSGPLHYRNGLVYLSNVTINATGDMNMMGGSSTTRTQTALALGVIAEGATGDGRVVPFAMIGCRLKRLALQERDPDAFPLLDSQDGMFVYNTQFRDVRSSGTINMVATNRSYVRGLALLQNLFEVGGSGQTALRVGGDSTTKAFDNVSVHFNSFVGGRLNIGYADVDAAAGVVKRAHVFGNLGNDTFNCKSDTFTGSPPGTVTSRGRVGNWELRYHVGNFCNVFASGSSNSFSTPQPDGSSWLGEWADPSNRFSVGLANISFLDDKSQPIGTGSLGGIYRLTGSTNAAYDAVPAGMAMLRYDPRGTARKDNATGAAGRYEREDA